MQDYKNNFFGNVKRKKRSGCKLIKGEFGEFISAWRISQKNGMMKLTANRIETKSTLGKKFKDFYNKKNELLHYYRAKITVIETGQTSWQYGFYNTVTKKLILKDINQIASCNGGRGGYWGKHISGNYNG